MDSTEVDIFGSSYTVKGDADPEYVRALARFVDDKMRALARKAPSSVSAQRIAVLAAINIADDLFKLKRRQQDVENLIEKKTGDLFDLLDEN